MALNKAHTPPRNVEKFQQSV